MTNYPIERRKTVMMRKLTITLALIGTLFTLNVHALGLSHIQVYSKLNEPLNAKINVLSIPRGTARTVKAELASARAFRRAGIDRPYVLTLLEFKVKPIDEDKTSAIIGVSTQQPFTEPFANFLVEVIWPGGRILREYTVLLDPPVFNESTSQAPIQLAGIATAPTVPVVPVPSPISQPMPTTVPNEIVTRSYPQVTPRTEDSSYTIPKKNTLWKIAKNETLWKIAKNTRPKTMSMHQHMRNIYNANPDAFIRKNRNLIKVGKVLRIPGTAAGTMRATHFPQRRGFTTDSTPTAPETVFANLPKPTTPRKKAELVIGSPKSLEKNPGTVSRSQAAGGNTAALEELRKQNVLLKEQKVSMAAENKELKKSLAETRSVIVTIKGQLDNMLKLQDERMATLQAEFKKQAEENQRLKQQIAQLQKSPQDKTQTKPEKPPEVAAIDETKSQTPEKPPQIVAEVGGTQPETQEKPTIAEVGETEPETPEKPPVVKAPVGTEPSFIATVSEFVEQQVPGGWMTVGVAGGIGGGALVLFLVGGFLRGSRKSTEPAEWKGGTEKTDEQIHDELARLDAEVQPADTIIIPGQPSVDPVDEVDPAFDEELREEVELYMAYENFDKAENLLNSALEQYPLHPEYRLKLLEVHAAAKEADKFEEQAQLLHAAVGGQGPLWNKALELWQELSPGQELLGAQSQESKGAGVAVAAGVAGAVAGGAIAAATLGEDETDESVETIDDDNALLDMDDGDAISLTETTGDESLDFDLGDDLGDDLSLDLENGMGEAESDHSTDDSLPDDDDSLSFDLDSGDDDGLSLDGGLDLDLDGDEDAESALSSGEELSLDDDDEFSLDDLGDDDTETAESGAEDNELSLDDELSLDGDDDELSLDGDDDTSADLSLDDDLSLDGDDDELSLDGDDDTSADLSLDDELSLDGDDDTSADLSLDDELSLDGDDDASADLSLDDELSLDGDDDASAD
ncbi:MAG TPA: LysM peptidoglycan-binding domain-containing protein, partial [Thioploca sp.]|nr:LysM peptidoglycan-binding domain-containing protein [Thioploca sp.]